MLKLCLDLTNFSLLFMLIKRVKLKVVGLRIVTCVKGNVCFLDKIKADVLVGFK